MNNILSYIHITHCDCYCNDNDSIGNIFGLGIVLILIVCALYLIEKQRDKE